MLVQMILVMSLLQIQTVITREAAACRPILRAFGYDIAYSTAHHTVDFRTQATEAKTENTGLRYKLRPLSNLSTGKAFEKLWPLVSNSRELYLALSLVKVAFQSESRRILLSEVLPIGIEEEEVAKVMALLSNQGLLHYDGIYETDRVKLHDEVTEDPLGNLTFTVTTEINSNRIVTARRRNYEPMSFEIWGSSDVQEIEGSFLHFLDVLRKLEISIPLNPTDWTFSNAVSKAEHLLLEFERLEGGSIKLIAIWNRLGRMSVVEADKVFESRIAVQKVRKALGWRFNWRALRGLDETMNPNPIAPLIHLPRSLATKEFIALKLTPPPSKYPKLQLNPHDVGKILTPSRQVELIEGVAP